jgi:hypothetical protein
MSILRRPARRALAVGLAALLGAPDAAFAASGKSLDAMSPAELEAHVKQLNETANWRKYRRPSDPPDFVPGKPVKVMVGAGSSFGRGGMRGGGGSFRRSGLSNRRNSRSSRRNGRDDAMAQDRGSSRSSSSRSSRSGSSFGSSRDSGSSFGSSRNRSSSSFDEGSFGD